VSAPNGPRELAWLVETFVERIPGVDSGVVVTTDGLVLAHSQRLARDTADHLAAVTSGLASLTAGAAQTLGAGNVNQVIVEMDGGYFFVSSISAGSALALMCQTDCDIGLVGYEMSLLVARIGQALTPGMRGAGDMAPPA
jgi:predicted regulator of Ras-like GTPase activity (Roadblock/LC7/MglB family)